MKRKFLLIATLMISFTLITGCFNYLEETKTETQKISLENQTTDLILQTLNGFVTIEPTVEDEIVFIMEKVASGTDELTLKDYVNKIEVDFNQEDGTISAILKNPSSLPSRISWIGVHFRVQLPIHQIKNIKIKTSNGFVEASDFSGTLDIVTSNGGVALTDVNGIIKVITSNGNISGNRIAGELNVVTSNGFVDVESSQGLCGADIKTSNARISFKSPIDEAGNYNLITSNGRIEMFVPEDSKMTVEAHTSNGEISCELPHDPMIDPEEDDVTFTVNDHGADTYLKTSNADIDIREGLF